MNPKVLATINFLRTYTEIDLKKRLRKTPSDWNVSFSKSSKEYDEIVNAYMQNNSCTKSRVIYHPIAIKLINLF